MSTTWRQAGRRLALGLSTLLGRRPRGFFIPYRHADAARPPSSYPALAPLFARAEPSFQARLAAAARHLDALLGFGGAPPAPRWEQDWFPRLDGALAYALTRELAPRRIVEIGSGHSTRFLARAVADGGLKTSIVAVDPAPRAPLTGLAIECVYSLAQDAPLAIFDALVDGDVLFVDSSHVLMPGSDVDFILNTLLPRLPAGAYVHIHDVFLPDGYPASWAWRGYNEQQAMAPLLSSGAYEIVWASHYAATRLAADVAASGLARLKLPSGACESSLWLRKIR